MQKQIENYQLFDRALSRLQSDIPTKEWPYPWDGELKFPDDNTSSIPYHHTVQLRHDIERLILRHGVDLRMANAMPSYNVEKDMILMPPPSRFKSRDLWNQTLFHELGHWTGPRLGRGNTMMVDHPVLNGVEEITAELVSAFLCEAYDINGQGHAKYIDDYSSPIPNDERISRIIMNRAIRATNYLLQKT